MALADVRNELVDDIRYELSVITERHPLSQLASVYEKVANGFEALGICNLLLFGNADRLFENLIRSGHTRIAFLRDCQRVGETTSFQLAISRWPSFMDVVVAGDHASAREIVSLSPLDWMPDGEYEDDYCFTAALHDLYTGTRGRERRSFQPLLDRWLTALAGEPTPRYDLVVALLDRNQLLFADSFERRLGEWDSWAERMRSGCIADDPTIWAQTQVFIEGLAILRFAEAAGLSVDRDYRGCPALARRPRRGTAPEDVFVALEREFPA